MCSSIRSDVEETLACAAPPSHTTHSGAAVAEREVAIPEREVVAARSRPAADVARARMSP